MKNDCFPGVPELVFVILSYVFSLFGPPHEMVSPNPITVTGVRACICHLQMINGSIGSPFL